MRYGSNKRKTARHLKNHFRRRLAERYGVAISDDAIRSAIKQIQDGEATYIDRISNRVSNHVVHINATHIGTNKRRLVAVAVGYDSKRKTVVTALPPDILEKVDEN